MRIKYFIPMLVAMLTLMASCSEDFEPTYLDDLKVSQSYIALPANGGTVEVTVNAKDTWAFNDIPEWLTVTPAQGAAGETKVTFSANATTESLTASILLNSGSKTQRINVIQVTEKTDLPISTCAEIIAGDDSKTYRAKGTVTRISNTIYGNWYLQDETGEIYIYGTLDKNGKNGQNNSIDAWGIEVGDILTVEGPKTTYNGTVELVDVAVLSIEKSLIKVDSLDIADNILPLEGGDFNVVLENKGDGVSVNIPDNAKGWLHINGVSITGTTTIVAFHADKNEGGDRSATLTFNTTDGHKNYTAEATVMQKGAIMEVTIEDFNSAPKGDSQYRVTGVVSQIANASRGRFYIKDFTGELYVYNLAGFEAMGVKEGDIVTLVGKHDEYNGTIELVSGVVEKHIDVEEVSISEFLQKEDAKDVYYMVTGTIDEIANTTYGNLYITDGENRLYVYGCYPGWGATGDFRKDFIPAAGIEVGDKLTMIGYKDTYKGTIELCGGIYFSHEKGQ